MEEEPEIQDSTSVMGVPTSVEDQLNTETSKPTKLNKNGKPRKQLSPEALERLAKAREKANAMRQQSYAKKLEEKVEKLKSKNDEVLSKKEHKEEPQEKELKEPEIKEPEIKEPEIKEVAKKPRGKKKTKIVVEQSSDDSDEFESNTNVVFVKRVSRKKKEVPIVPEPQLEMELPPPEPPRPPPRPELTPQQRVLKIFFILLY
jgi:hypothetical protein